MRYHTPLSYPAPSLGLSACREYIGRDLRIKATFKDVTTIPHRGQTVFRMTCPHKTIFYPS